LPKEEQDGVPFIAKFCDFGVSEKLKAPFEETDIISKTAGTFHFFPPECCDPNIETHSGRAADIWALGVTLFCLIFNELPFWNQDVNEF
jgi:[calcium/calmodulin-dependent protein kinase] kinase